MDDAIYYAVVMTGDYERVSHTPDDGTEFHLVVDDGTLIIVQNDVETGEEEICSMYAPGRWLEADLTANLPGEE